MPNISVFKLLFTAIFVLKIRGKKLHTLLETPQQLETSLFLNESWEIHIYLTHKKISHDALQNKMVDHFSENVI